MAATLLKAMRERRRLWVVFGLTLLPWPAVWFGMYRLDSLIWTFVLYHGVCLLPAAILGRRLWLPSVKWPTRGQWLAVAVAALLILPLSPLVWATVGTRFISPHALLSVVTLRGFRAAWFLPLGLYFVPVNATLEELFWRGVILNELRGTGDTVWTLGAVWTAFTFAAWHYLVLHLLLRPGWAEATVLLILSAGIFLAWLYRRTHSIIVPILWHALIFDLALIVIFAAVLRVK